MPIDVGKAAAGLLRVSAGDVQIDALGIAVLHLRDNGPRDHIARLQRVGERRAALVDQHPAKAAQRLGNQERGLAWIVQHGRVELHKLHVAHPRTGPPRHGHAIARGYGRVGGVQKNLPAAARSQQRNRRQGRDCLR